jgi:hypothetical protein
VSVRPGQCGHSGGQGIGAGHVCRCVRRKGHPLDSERPHGCTCMALWADSVTEVKPREPDWFCRCGHLWTTHNIHVGCTADWLYDLEGMVEHEGCDCLMAHVDKSDKEVR